MNTLINKTLAGLFAGALAVVGSCLVKADDTEVFVNNTQTNVTPNLMFLLDLSGSMEFTPGGFPTRGVEQSRLEILQNSVTSLLSDPNLPELNIGLATFQNDSGGTLLFPIAPMDADANSIDPDIASGTPVKDVVISLVNNAVAGGATPTVDQMHEVALYLRGEKPLLGSADFGTWDQGQQNYSGGNYRSSHPGSYTGSIDYVPLGTEGSFTSTCSDFSGFSTPGENECAGPESLGAELTCENVEVPPEAGRTCERNPGGTCDASCGTRQVCRSGFTYTEASSCLADPFSGGTWVTGTSGGQATACCTESDASGVECLNSTGYSRACNAAEVTECRVGRNREPSVGGTFQSCQYAQKDNRVYQSPINTQCQRTAVVLLTDGDPSKNTVDRGVSSGGQADSPFRVRELIANNDSIDSNTRDDVSCADQSESFNRGPGGYTSPNCLIELADFLHSELQRPTVVQSTVELYPIGFGLVGPVAEATSGLLQSAAAAGGGEAFVAGDQDELVQAFQNVVNSVSSNNQSFTSLATSFDLTNLATSNKTYLSLFEPSFKRAWEGNLKGYFLDQGELVDINGQPATLDSASGDAAFRAGAQSFWSAIPDGNQPISGGFVSTLAPAGRRLFTIVNPLETANVNLADGAHLLNESNTALTKQLLGLPDSASAAQRSDTIAWLRSERVGDPLHAKPVLVDYGTATGKVVYFMTNQGFIHAVDTNEPTTANGSIAGGEELFAFMPRELLQNAAAQAADTTGPRIYGLDGQITVLKIDDNGDGVIEGTDRVILFFNMRRGGGSYYALEVTDPAAPRLLWQISQGDAGFEALGQSWSSATIARLNDNGSDRLALVFAGGYDVEHDVLGTTRSATGNASGRGIYVIDADTGGLLMSIGDATSFTKRAAGMKYSMPADVRVIDTNGNGVADRLYAVDLGAQIWRVDIAEGGSASAATSYTVNRLADFGRNEAGVTNASTNRRFFYAPGVARYLRDNVLQYAISIGSGYRAHPLDTQIQDHVYVLFDPDVDTGPPANPVVAADLNSLFDATVDLVSSSDEATAAAARSDLANKDGYYIALDPSEKVLSRVRVFRNRLLFNAFRLLGDGTTCGAVGTANRFFALDVGTATGLLPTYVDNVLVIDEYQRSNEVADQAIILDEPVVINYRDDDATSSAGNTQAASSCTAIFSGSQQQLNLCTPPVKVNWRRN